MLRPIVLLLPALLAAPVFAQKIEVKAASGDAQTLRFSINSKLQVNQTNKVLINGEEPGAGGGGGGGRGGFGGGGGESKADSEVVFEQGPATANWRHYQKLVSTETRPGRDGDPTETKIEGALQGKKLTLKTEGGKTSWLDGEDATAKPVDEALTRDVPGRVSLAGLLPSGAVAVGEEFDLGKTFGGVVANLVHPVTPERPQMGGGQGGGRGGRGQGGQGGGDAGGGQGQGGGGRRGQGGEGGGQGGGDAAGGGGRGPGARGGMGGARFGGGVGSVATQLIAANKLETKATGKLISVDEKDGRKIATFEIKATMTGKGKSTDLGLRAQMGGFGGGRGGRGQGGGGDAGAAPADNGSDTVDANLAFTGKVMVDLGTSQVANVELAGDLTIGRATNRTMPGRDGGDDMKMESTNSTKGKLELKVACEAVAEKK